MRLIHVTPTTELAGVLATAEREPVMLDCNGMTFELHRVPVAQDLFANYDPHEALAALDRLAAAFKGVDADKLKKDLRAARGQRDRTQGRHGLPA